jgi:hypothetical protein
MECSNCHKPDVIFSKNRKMCTGCIREFSQHQRAKNKILVIKHYSNGTMQCQCCDEPNLEFLGIDHINGGGNIHRKQIKRVGGFLFYIWLRQQGFPEGFRVLCQNCNLAYGVYGYCPHKSGSKLKNIDCEKEFGTRLSGEQVTNSKLCSSDIPEIIRLLKTGLTVRAIAKIHKVSEPTIASVRDGKTWNQITGLPRKDFGPSHRNTTKRIIKINALSRFVRTVLNI